MKLNAWPAGNFHTVTFSAIAAPVFASNEQESANVSMGGRANTALNPVRKDFTEKIV